MKEGLEFLSTLIWQAILVVCLWSLRSEIRALFKRLVSIKYGDTEAVFQEQAAAPLEPSPLASQAMKVRDEDGFFTNAGIEGLVQQSRYFKPNDSLRDSMLVFSTPRQHTWLVATSSDVYFILDDDSTRASERLIQMLVPLSEALPVNAQRESADAGSFQLGDSGYWYYSRNLLGPPKTAVHRLTKFIRTAQGQ